MTNDEISTERILLFFAMVLSSIFIAVCGYIIWSLRPQILSSKEEATVSLIVITTISFTFLRLFYLEGKKQWKE